MNDLQSIIGATLWWAEGTKSRQDKRWKNSITYPLEITNTDPKIIIRPVGNKPGKTLGTCKIRYHDKQAYYRAKAILDSILSSVKMIEG